MLTPMRTTKIVNAVVKRGKDESLVDVVALFDWEDN